MGPVRGAAVAPFVLHPGGTGHWRGRGEGMTRAWRAIGMFWLGVARAWRGRGTGMSCSPWRAGVGGAQRHDALRRPAGSPGRPRRVASCQKGRGFTRGQGQFRDPPSYGLAEGAQQGARGGCMGEGCLLGGTRSAAGQAPAVCALPHLLLLPYGALPTTARTQRRRRVRRRGGHGALRPVGRNGRGRVPDASRTIDIKETDASRARPGRVLS
eukprot:gene15952-biopygen15780